MVFSCAHTRLTRTSSDLRILSAVLLPPSPILNADDLLVPSASGEIPIFFEAATNAHGSPLLFENPPSLWNLGEELKSTDRLDTTEGVGNLTRGNGIPREDRMAVEPDEKRVTTTLSNNRHAESSPNALLVGNVLEELKNASHPAYCDLLDGDTGRLFILDNCSLPISEGHGNFKGLQDPQTSYPNAAVLSSTTVVPDEDVDGDQLPMIATFYTYSTLPTPIFAPSPSGDVISPSSSPTSRQRHRRPLERARAVRLPGRPWSPRIQANDEAHLVHNVAPPTKDACTGWQLAGSATMAPTHACTVDKVQPLLKHVALPEELSWLQHMIIELWIDQEGFRAVKPRMQLMGYSPRTRSLYPYESVGLVGPDITAGVAEFMPTKREAFTFHYATLDSPPTLRMISVAGYESRDYISRQAALSVKVNGVYTVLGAEAFTGSILNSDAQGPRIPNVRLRWKFDYVVGDRKLDGTGKAIHGEKTLTPLTFSCSPYLFQPLQGKKTGLMHIMKKSLATKLGSQRLEPPPCYTSSRNILPRTSHYLLAGRDVVTHARSHSDAFATNGGHYSPARSPLNMGGTTQDMDCVQRARRRRASSAGEDSLPRSRNHGVVEGGMPARFH